MTQPISLNPETYTQGGFLDDVDATLTELRFCLWDYGDAQKYGVSPALRVTIETEGYDKSVTQHYRAGDSKFLQPSNDGKNLLPVSMNKDHKHGTLREDSNASRFIRSLVESGFPRHLLDGGDISVVDGTKVHLISQLQPKRPGLSGQGDKDKQIVLVEKILSDFTNAKTSDKTKKSTTVSSDEDLASKYILKILDREKGSVSMDDLVQKAFAFMIEDKVSPKERNEAIQKMADNDYLLDSEKWVFNPKKKTLESIIPF